MRSERAIQPILMAQRAKIRPERAKLRPLMAKGGTEGRTEGQTEGLTDGLLEIPSVFYRTLVFGAVVQKERKRERKREKRG